MTETVDILVAFEHAIRTAREQPGQVPEVSQEWLEQAESALRDKDYLRVYGLAGELIRAHAQYRADFDVRAWLFDLRNAQHALRLRAAQVG